MLLHYIECGKAKGIQNNVMRRNQLITGEALNSNDKLTFLLDTLPEAVIFLDGSATILHANAGADWLNFLAT